MTQTTDPEFDLLVKIERLRLALEFYADPETYHGVGWLCDLPGGGWAEDFSDDHGHPDYGRPMPGKLAREMLKANEP